MPPRRRTRWTADPELEVSPGKKKRKKARVGRVMLYVHEALSAMILTLFY
jgi:hypothetical protein